MRTAKANINGMILSWARRAHNYSVEQAAKKAAVKPTKWSAWEAAADRPSLRQLHALSDLFHLPEAVFYALTPPNDEAYLKKLTDFRGLQQDGLTPKILGHVSKAKSIRASALELCAQLKIEFPKLPQPKSMGIEAIAKAVTDFLQLDLDHVRKLDNANQAFSYHRELMESKGILILQAENVTRDEFSAMSIAEEQLPIIIIRSGDETNRKIFSLYHEITHLFLRKSAICSIWDSADETEQLCDRVAGEVLLPTNIFYEALGKRPDFSEEELAILSKLFKVSRLAIALKLVHLKVISWSKYQTFAKTALLKSTKRFGRSKEPHIPRILNKNSRLLARLVFEAYNRNEISLGTVCSYLKTKAEYVPKLEAKLYEGAGG